MLFHSSPSYGKLIHTISFLFPPERNYRSPSLRLATFACLWISLHSILIIWHKPDLTSLSCIDCHACPDLMLSNSSLMLTASFPCQSQEFFKTDYSFPLHNPAPKLVLHCITSFLSYLSQPVPILLLYQSHNRNKS